MDKELRSRLKKGLGAQAYAKIVNVLIQLATVPLLITTWGVELYGAWLILTAIPIYLTMSDLGFATAAQNEMTMAVGRGNRAAELETFQSAWLLVLAVSFPVALVLGGLVPLAPFSDWLNLAALSDATATLILWLLGLHVLLTIQTNLIYAGFHCVGAYGQGHFLLASIRLLEFALLVLAVVLGGGPVAAAGAWLAGRVAGTIGMRLVLRRANPDLALGWSHARMATVTRLARPAFAALAFPLGGAMNLQGVVIVIGALFSPAAVAVFATLRAMTRFGIQLVGALNATVYPEISAAFGADNTERVRKLHNHACQAAAWVSATVAVALLLFGAWLVELWTAGAVHMQWDIFVLFVAILMVNGLWQASLMLVYATNRHMRFAAVYVAVNLGALVGAYVLGQLFGLTGVAASSSGASCARSSQGVSRRKHARNVRPCGRRSGPRYRPAASAPERPAPSPVGRRDSRQDRRASRRSLQDRGSERGIR